MKKCFLKIIKHSGEIGKSILYDEDFKTNLPIIDKLSEKNIEDIENLDNTINNCTQ